MDVPVRCADCRACERRAGLAQGFYYKEIRKDDRIYVFNIAEEADRFEKSGEMGRGITRPGAGPNGETVVADSARALQLFFFKHGISEAVPEPPAPIQRIEWRDGKTRITTDFAYLEYRIASRSGTRTSFRTTFLLCPARRAGDSRGSFRSVARSSSSKAGSGARPISRRPRPSCRSSPTSCSSTGRRCRHGAQPANVGAFLEDANIAWDPQGRGKFRILAGQFKVPFGRQQMTSSGNQQFVDRSLGPTNSSGGATSAWPFRASSGATARVPRRLVQRQRPDARRNDNDTFQYNAR